MQLPALICIIFDLYWVGNVLTKNPLPKHACLTRCLAVLVSRSRLIAWYFKWQLGTALASQVSQSIQIWSLLQFTAAASPSTCFKQGQSDMTACVAPATKSSQDAESFVSTGSCLLQRVLGLDNKHSNRGVFKSICCLHLDLGRRMLAVVKEACTVTPFNM